VSDSQTVEETKQGLQPEVVDTRLRSVLTILGLVAAAGIAYLGARYWQTGQPTFTRVAVAAECDLRAGPCQRQIGAGAVEFAVTPKQIPLMKTLRLSVRGVGVGLDQVAVEIRGLNMDMGLNRTRMEQGEDGRWHGETILPVCSQRRMEWEAAVQLSVQGRMYELPFPFHTTRP
jgi:hypothetical protein